MAGVNVAAFIAALRGEAAQAEIVGGSVDRWFRIAGLALRLRFHGDALVPVIVPAIAHLEVAAQSHADLTLHAWDCATLGMAYPEAPVGKQAFTPRGEVRGLSEGGVTAAYEPGGRLLSLFDAESGEAYYCVGDAAAIPRFDRAEPIRGILSWFMRANGRQLIHAAAVGFPDGGVLMVGRSGAGKSNTALATLSSNLRFIADDFCIVSTDGSPSAWSLYSTAKTRQSDWRRQPFLAGLAPDVDPLGDKVIYFLEQAMPDRLIAEFPLKALLLLRRGGSACAVRPVPPHALLAASAPDTARLLPDAGPEVLRAVGRLVRRLPCFELSLGPDPERIGGAIEGLLAGLRADRLQPA